MPQLEPERSSPAPITPPTPDLSPQPFLLTSCNPPTCYSSSLSPSSSVSSPLAASPPVAPFCHFLPPSPSSTLVNPPSIPVTFPSPLLPYCFHPSSPSLSASAHLPPATLGNPPCLSLHLPSDLSYFSPSPSPPPPPVNLPHDPLTANPSNPSSARHLGSFLFP